MPGIAALPYSGKAASAAGHDSLDSPLPSGPAFPGVVPSPGSYRLCQQEGGGRRKAEQFIHNRFAEAFDADVGHFLPTLFSLRQEDGDWLAAFGIRPAGEHRKLFLESYLEQPIEAVLSADREQSIPRHTIVEVGNLAAKPGNTRLMIIALTALLHREGFQWVAFTGLPLLRNAFHRLGLAPLSLCRADKGRLPEAERDRWNRYYDHAPCVMAGHIGHGLDALLSRPDAAALLRRIHLPREVAR